MKKDVGPGQFGGALPEYHGTGEVDGVVHRMDGVH